MIDSFENVAAAKLNCHKPVGNSVVDGQPYAVVTLHRPSNVDQREKLAELVAALAEVSEADDSRLRHPSPYCASVLRTFDLIRLITNSDGIRATTPLGYIDFMNLVSGCTIAITDSGGVQEETTYPRYNRAQLGEKTPSGPINCVPGNEPPA